MKHQSRHAWRIRWAVAVAVAWTAVGCQEPQPSGTVVAQREQVKMREVSPVSPSDETLAIARKLTVVAGMTPPGPEVVEEVLVKALRRRGFEVVMGAEAKQADLILAVWSATRAGGAWGGIPSQQVLLRYTLLDAAERTPVGNGVDSGSYADAEIQTATLGALRKAADNLTRKLRTAILRLPPPSAVVAKPPPAAPSPVLPHPSLAPLPFRNITARAELGGWCESLASIAAQEFQRTGQYRIVERVRLGEILKEEDIAAATEANNAGALRRVGQQLGVDLLLVGEVVLRPNGDLAVSARVVTAKEAEVRQVIHVAGPAPRANELELTFRRQLARPTDVWIIQHFDQLRQAPIVWPDAAQP